MPNLPSTSRLTGLELRLSSWSLAVGVGRCDKEKFSDTGDTSWLLALGQSSTLRFELRGSGGRAGVVSEAGGDHGDDGDSRPNGESLAGLGS